MINAFDTKGRRVLGLVAATAALASYRESTSSAEGVGNFESVESLKRFLTAGRAIITLTDQRNGNHFTYKISRPGKGSKAKDSVEFFVGVLSSPNSGAGYSSCGYVSVGSTGVFHNVRRVSWSAPSVMLFKAFWESLHATGQIPDDIEPLHAGRCGRCGRELTHPESIRSGIGPECAGRL